MKTNKQNIEKELVELNASFLLAQKKKQVSDSHDLMINTTEIMDQVMEDDKPVKIRRLSFYIGGIAASIVFGFLLFSVINNNVSSTENTIAQLEQEDILHYIEDEIIYFSEDEILALVDVEETNNLFDNSGISSSYLEEYFINELNEEIQMEDLL